MESEEKVKPEDIAVANYTEAPASETPEDAKAPMDGPPSDIVPPAPGKKTRVRRVKEEVSKDEVVSTFVREPQSPAATDEKPAEKTYDWVNHPQRQA